MIFFLVISGYALIIISMNIKYIAMITALLTIISVFFTVIMISLVTGENLFSRLLFNFARKFG